MESHLFDPTDLRLPRAASDEELGLVHTSDYLRRVTNGLLTKKEILRLGLPWSSALVTRARSSCGGTIEAAKTALREGIAVNLAGGTHHAFHDHGEGYCLFNDCAVAARLLQEEGLVTRVLIIDCDAHQGNGTAAIFQNDPSVFTFSIHGAKNFPLRKESSDLDIPLDDGTRDEAYLKALEEGLVQALERAEADLVFYIAGADPHEGDRLGRLSLSMEGLARRDDLVLSLCGRRRGLPVAVTMGGGYGRRLEDTVAIHFQTVCISRAFQEAL